MATSQPGCWPCWRLSPLECVRFWGLFTVAFNLVSAADIVVDYYRGNQIDLPALAGQLAATYWIPIISGPLLIITHVAARAEKQRRDDQMDALPFAPGFSAPLFSCSDRLFTPRWNCEILALAAELAGQEVSA